MIIVAFLLGIYGGFFGAGYGTLLMFLLVYSGYTFVNASGTARFIGLIMSLTASFIFARNGLINYEYALSLGMGSSIGAWIGAGMGIKKGNKFIKTLMIILVIITVIKLTFDFVF